MFGRLNIYLQDNHGLEKSNELWGLLPLIYATLQKKTINNSEVVSFEQIAQAYLK